jgi:hypothetical protein
VRAPLCGLLVVCTVACLGCAPAAPVADVPPALLHIAEVHRAKCGNCHVRVEPGSRSRTELEGALPRHRSRVHLTDDEWSQLVEYLARPVSG